MINRVLIRMKAVQLLYSYLLVEKTFHLESQPSDPTKEKRFAYTLYLDVIYLLTRLAHLVKGKNRRYPLADTRFILRVENDDRLKALDTKYKTEKFPFQEIEQNLADLIKESFIFREFEKENEEDLFKMKFWENVFNTIIFPHPVFNKIVKELPGFTLGGVDRMKAMMESTFENYYTSRDNIGDALKTLETSLKKARDLYIRLLALPVELARLRMRQLEENSRRYLANIEDINPNLRFVNNKVVKILENDPEFTKYVEQNHLSWLDEDMELMLLLLKKIITSDLYTAYLEKSEISLEDDVDFWKNIYTELLLNDEYFLEYLENKSVFWNDDLEIMCSFVLKTLKRMENPETADHSVLPMYKDGEHGKDATFGAELVNYVIRNKTLYRKYIEDVLQQDKWASDRLAFMDVVITMTALAEIINYPEIPLSVSVNEYIEIAKSYSSEKSGQFVHGLLATIINKLQEEGIVHKN